MNGPSATRTNERTKVVLVGAIRRKDAVLIFFFAWCCVLSSSSRKPSSSLATLVFFFLYIKAPLNGQFQLEWRWRSSSHPPPSLVNDECIHYSTVHYRSIFTFSFDDSWTSQIDFVAHEDDNLLFGTRLLPEVLEDLFSELETATVRDRISEHKGVWIIRRQAILHLNKHHPAATSQQTTDKHKQETELL